METPASTTEIRKNIATYLILTLVFVFLSTICASAPENWVAE